MFLEDNVIEVKDVQKKFKVFFDKGNSLKEKLLFKDRNKYEDRWVLKGISFSIKSGEAVGLVGENGCGKSTLLKLLTKIMYPDKGLIKVKGRVSSLIELGAGFHPDMSGKENIYTNAAIFGLTRSEIESRVDKIISFSELGDFIDNPVRTYSSGMYMRLAFSIAINVNADILLIDEILAVGDASFQSKCFKRLNELKRSGVTIVIVSHDTGSIEKLCDRAIWINNGEIRNDGEVRSTIYDYIDYVMNKTTNMSGESCATILDEDKYSNVSENVNEDTEIVDESKERGNKQIIIASVKMLDFNTNKEKYNFKPSDKAVIRLEYKRINDNINNALASILIGKDDLVCFSTNSYLDTGSLIDIKKEGSIEFVLNEIQLLEGEYFVDISILNEYWEIYHHISYSLKFTVYNEVNDVGVFRMNHEWINK